MDSRQEQSAGFEFPPAKRQRTDSPPQQTSTHQTSDLPATAPPSAPPSNVVGPLSNADPAQEDHTSSATTLIPGLGGLPDSEQHARPSEDFDDSNAILDVLMQHVESTGSPPAMQSHRETIVNKDEPANIEVTGDVVAIVSAEVHHVPREAAPTEAALPANN